MNDFVRVLAISLLPAAGNILGALVAESVKAPPWIIGAALHGAAGVAIAVVSVDLMPRRLPVIPTWMLVAAFAGGAAFSVALARGFKVWAGGRKGRSGTWMVYLAVAADLLTDGLMVGAGSAIAGGLGFLLGLSQVVANVPGDFATIGNFRNRQVRRSRRLVISARFALPARVGAALDFDPGLYRGIRTVRGAVGVFGIGESPCAGTAAPCPHSAPLRLSYQLKLSPILLF
jgi:ZIP family zinc transporter